MSIVPARFADVELLRQSDTTFANNRGTMCQPAASARTEEETAHTYETVNTTVIVTVRDLMLDDFLLEEPKKPDAGEP